MRYAISLLFFVLAGCATPGGRDGGIAIETTSAGQSLTGAQCSVVTDAGSWQVTTPAVAPIGAPRGDLRVVCDKSGYRTSEVVYRATPGRSNMTLGIGGGSGGGRVGVGFGFGIPIGQGSTTYPSEIVVDLTPQ